MYEGNFKNDNIFGTGRVTSLDDKTLTSTGIFDDGTIKSVSTVSKVFIGKINNQIFGVYKGQTKNYFTPDGHGIITYQDLKFTGIFSEDGKCFNGKCENNKN